MPSLKIKEMSIDEIDAFIDRVEQARSYSLALSAEDMQLLLEAFKAFIFLQERLAENDLTIHKLRKLLGMIAASEKRRLDETKVSEDDKKERPSQEPKPSPKGHGKRGHKDFPEAAKVYHTVLEGVKAGDSCPDCGRGKLYKYEPSILVRISAHTPYETELHIRTRLRCNRCQQFYSAKLPAEVLADGDENQRFGHSARAMMAVQKYSAGLPFKRQESLQEQVGLKITASTIYDQCEKLADSGFFIHKELIAQGREAESFFIDDTRHRINHKKNVKSKRTGQEKSGVYTSGLIAELSTGQELVLFKTNVGHAGDFIDEVLAGRRHQESLPLVMSDALSSNNVTVTKVRRCFCNAHARRQFFDLRSQAPVEVDKILDYYAKVYQNEKHCKVSKMNPPERLAYHREHSLPLMNEMLSYANGLLSSRLFEANSNMGKAVAYLNKYWEGLIAFTRWEKASLDNNPMERALRTVVLGRKNFYFYKTTTGAAVSDVLTSLIATCKLAGANPFLYLTAIGRYQDKARETPALWLPWNYLDNLA